MYPYFDICGFKIGTYGTCILLAFFLVAVFSLKRGKPVGLRLEDLLIIAAMAFGGAVVVGGLLYVCVTYSFAQIVDFIRTGDFRFLGSGIVFYGGLIGGIAGAILGILVARCDFQCVEYSVVPFIPLGHAIGRIGCVMAGCCYGFEYEGFLALHYPNALSGISPQQGYFPVQPLESLLNMGICLLLLWLSKKTKRKLGLLAWYLALYAVVRFFLEMLRGDAVRGIWSGFSTSQYISFGLLTACVLRLLILYMREKVRE